ncbi:PAS domain S-box protein [Candidatus Bealeia paramacronuclearis]
MLSLLSGLLMLSFFSTKDHATIIAQEMSRNIKDREFRIRQLIDTTPGAIYSCTPDEERRVTFLSDFIEDITGFPTSHFIGQSTSDFTTLIHPEDRKFRIRAILENLEKQGRFSCEYRLIDRNKSEKWLFEQGHFIFDEAGIPQQIIGAIFDITSRKIAEQEAERLSLALQNAAECIAFLDRHLMFKEVNPSFAELAGWSQEEMIGLALPIIVYPDDLEKAQNLYKTSLNQSKIRSEVRGVRADGSQFYMSMTFVSSFDKNKKLLGTYCFVKDISHRKKIEEELRKAKDAALEASRAKSEFLAMMSHELRTPLNAIIGYSDLLAEQAQDENQTQTAGDLNRIKDAGQHLLSLINDILDVSKLEAGKTEIYHEIFSVDDLIFNVNGMAQPLMKLNHNEFILEDSQNLGLMNSDFVKLRQNLLNLLSNAAKFTENGKISLSIRIEKNKKEDWLVFSVRDTGCGITPQQLKKLFNPFVQADTSTTRKYGGTGLGLTLVKRYTEMMGGSIAVESISGQGTTFVMRLPRGNIEESIPLGHQDALLRI